MEDARNVTLFGKEIPVRKYGCSNEGKNPLWIDIPRVNLFVQVTNKCNANCPFCIYHNNEEPSFDLKKYSYILNALTSNKSIDIGKLNFTGGEPTLNFSLFEDIVNTTKENLDMERKPEITLNTNGLNLSKVIKYSDFLDSIGLSRHHYDDKINCKIFGTTSVAKEEDIINFNRTSKKPEILQLRCNLINGYIDSYDEIKKYLERAIILDSHDCGFVTLAPNNDYCKQKQIDFTNLVKINKEIIQVNKWERIEDNTSYCQCANYVYMSNSGEFCKFYSRLFCRNDIIDGILVFDGKNLRFGFGGEIII